jgi:peroxiredoxin
VEVEVVSNDVLELARAVGKQGLLEGVAGEVIVPAFSRLDGLDIGTPLPDFAAPDMAGTDVTLGQLEGSKVLLVNWSPWCGFCDRVAPDLAGVQDDLDQENVRLVLVSRGEADDNQRFLDEYGLRCTILLADSGIEAFEALGTPAAYLIDEEGKVAQPLSVGADQVPVLALTAANRFTPVDGHDHAGHDHDHAGHDHDHDHG